MRHLFKIHPWLLIAAIALLAQSCSEDNNDYINLSSESFAGVSAYGETLSVAVSSDIAWKVTSSAPDWCQATPATGRGDGNVTITVAPNFDTAQRRAVVTVASNSGAPSRMVEIVQEKGNMSIEDYTYDLPVIFHVLYVSESDPEQHTRAERLHEILAGARNLYLNNHSGIDMGVTFNLATTDPDGKKLSIPGVEYIKWDGDYPIGPYDFMYDESGRYVKYLWDPNRYINVMIYNFAGGEENEYDDTIAGISHLPLSYTGSYLEGLPKVNYQTLTLDNLGFPYCVSINSLYIDDTPSAQPFDPNEASITLAHEFGHYLGLHHAFSENEEGGCEDTDYCADTPSYDRYDYVSYIFHLYETGSPLFVFENTVKRTSCDGSTFVSRNIMDYYISYSDSFTHDQRARVRHVLMYSPLIPGPKLTVDDSKSRAAESRLKLPIVVRQ